jgi:hypothetical protein
MEINLMPHANLNKKSYDRAVKGMRYVKDSPCNLCIVLSMCLNKTATQICDCPLLDPIFYSEAIKLKAPGSILVRIKPLHIEFWLTRNSATDAVIDVIADNIVLFTSKVIKLEKDTDYD